MANEVFWRSHQLLQNKFFDSSTPSMRKVDDGGENWTKTGGKMIIMAEIVATNIIDCNADCSCQY